MNSLRPLLLLAVSLTACSSPSGFGALVSVELAGSGLGFVDSTPRGLHCPGTCQLEVPLRQDLVLEAGEGQQGSTFIGWSGACSGLGTCQLSVHAPARVIAAFALRNETVVTRVGEGHGTVHSEPAGIDCGDDCVETFSPETEVSLFAEADSSSVFTGWSGACTGLETCVISAAEAKLVTATFAPRMVQFTVSLVGDGGGSVSSVPSGITCGTTCVANFRAGTPVTLSANPAPGSFFAGWGGACSGDGGCQLTPTEATTVTADFHPRAEVRLDVTSTGNGAGTITSLPRGIECGASCAASFSFGSVVTLTALPSLNSLFTGWGGACQGTGPCTLTVSSPMSVVANFTLRASPLTLSAPAATIALSSTVLFTASGGLPPYLFTVTSGLGSFLQGTGQFTASNVPGFVVVRVQDSVNTFAEATVQVGQPLVLTPQTALLAATETMTFTASGGTPPYSWSVLSGGGVIDALGRYQAPNVAGQATVRVTDRTSNSADATLTITELSLAAQNPVSVLGAMGVISGDWNGDGQPDLTVAGLNGLVTFTATGDAGFSAPQTQSVGHVMTVTPGDWNRDGRADFAMTIGSNTNLTLLQSAADGGFNGSLVSSGGVITGGLTSGDYDRDGVADLLVGLVTGFSVLRGVGDGTFQAPQFTSTTPFLHLAQGDWDHDGIIDLAVAGPSTNVKVLLGDGTGAFIAGADLTAGSVRDLAAADVNHDGNLDLVVADLGSSVVNVYLGQGNGTFQTTPRATSVAQNPTALVLGDWDGDGTIDLAVTDTFGAAASHLSLLHGNRTGGFIPWASVVMPAGADGLATADLDVDGRPDFAVTNNSAGTLTVVGSRITSRGPPRFTIATRSLGLSPGLLLAADWNLDGTDDLLITQSSGLRWNFADGLGSFVPATTTLPIATPLMALVAGDWNRDGKLDVAQVQGPQVGVTLGPVFTNLSTMDAGLSPSALITGDWNRDGKLDLAASNLSSGDVSLLLGAGDGTFANTHSADAGLNPSALTTGDWNRDGRPDLVVAQNGNEVLVLLGHGDGTFQSAPPLFGNAVPTAVLSGDWNHDGKLDLALTEYGSSTLSLRWGAGDGSFPTSSTISLTETPGTVITGDFNGDGWPDFATIAATSGQVRLLIRAGYGGYTTITVGTVSGGGALTSGDWNRDGRLDLAVAQPANDSVTLFLSLP